MLLWLATAMPASAAPTAVITAASMQIKGKCDPAAASAVARANAAG